MKALQLCPESGLGGPECCLRVSLLPLRLNIDQVHTYTHTTHSWWPWSDFPCMCFWSVCFHSLRASSISQDALFFLKDFFSNMASGVNPYMPVDLAAEGRRDTLLVHASHCVILCDSLSMSVSPPVCLSVCLSFCPSACVQPSLIFLCVWLLRLSVVKPDATQKQPEDGEPVAGLGPDLTASVETTFSEQSSSSAGSSSSSTEQPIYFR